MNKAAIKTAFTRWQEQNPTPTTELLYASNYQLLIAVILSAQSTDKAVNKVTAQLFDRAPTPETMLELTLEELKNYIKSLGLYAQKAQAILQTSQILVKEYRGQVPGTRKALEALPGVGRKTANVILNTAFNMPVIAVDTHIFRLSHRLGFSKGKTPAAVEADLMQAIPKPFLKNAHHWMILHGRYICKAKNPLCSECVIQDLCPFYGGRND